MFEYLIHGTLSWLMLLTFLMDQAAAHLQVASLLAMLCDGCRADGQGFNPLPLDRLLWQFGILVSEALALKDVKLNEERAAFPAAISCHFMQLSWKHRLHDEGTAETRHVEGYVRIIA
eukprot:Skav224162  [mRNA]  locus=scaffold2007:194471:194824:+ [translate_table: standard]